MLIQCWLIVIHSDFSWHNSDASQLVRWISHGFPHDFHEKDMDLGIKKWWIYSLRIHPDENLPDTSTQMSNGQDTVDFTGGWCLIHWCSMVCWHGICMYWSIMWWSKLWMHNQDDMTYRPTNKHMCDFTLEHDRYHDITDNTQNDDCLRLVQSCCSPKMLMFCNKSCGYWST